MKARASSNALDCPMQFETRRRRRRRAFFYETQPTDADNPAVDTKSQFKIDDYTVVLDTVITEVKTRFNYKTV